MAWTQVGDGRWCGDDDRHLLLMAEEPRWVEFHDGTVHVYEQLGERYNPLSPLADVTWLATYERPDLTGVDEAGLWQAMAADEYVKPAP